MSDDLIGSGVGPRTILRTLALDDQSIVGNLNKYDPDQPRVPAGSGAASGQWTSESGANEPAGSVAPPNRVTKHSALPFAASLPSQRGILALPFSVVSSIVWGNRTGRSGENTSRTISYSEALAGRKHPCALAM